MYVCQSSIYFRSKNQISVSLLGLFGDLVAEIQNTGVLGFYVTNSLKRCFPAMKQK